VGASCATANIQELSVNLASTVSNAIPESSVDKAATDEMLQLGKRKAEITEGVNGCVNSLLFMVLLK
jgi:hypothetical protein